MKYRHYSPRAQVVLYECTASPPSFQEVARLSQWEKVGFVRTKSWRKCSLFSDSLLPVNGGEGEYEERQHMAIAGNKTNPLSLLAAVSHAVPKPKALTIHDAATGAQLSCLAVDLGPEAKNVARGLFFALRELDKQEVPVIFVEGIADGGGDVAAAVMNRLRKAAEVKVSSN
jgi:L-threonylcarbamoyladenylate synthase